MRITLIAKPVITDSGLGRYTVQLGAMLAAQGHKVTIVQPTIPFPGWVINFLKKWLSIDLTSFFNNYPIWARYPNSDIYHLASQNLATLMLFHPPPGVTVITVHDIIPWISRDDPEQRIYRHRLDEFFDYLALQSLKRADAILSDSDFTRSILIEKLGLDGKMITTVFLGINNAS